MMIQDPPWVTYEMNHDDIDINLSLRGIVMVENYKHRYAFEVNLKYSIFYPSSRVFFVGAFVGNAVGIAVGAPP